MRPLLLAALLLVPAALGAQDRTERPKPFAALSASAGGLRDSIVARARAQVGTRYVRGGADPSRGFDCSGLVKFVLSALELDLPRTARQQATVGQVVARTKEALKPGDLLTFGSAKGVDHVGIYIGNGRYIHASSVAGRVIESPLDRARARRVKAWRGVRRLLAVSDTAPDGR